MKRLENYDIKGDIEELVNIINPNARVSITLDDLISVLSKKRANYVEVRYGESLSDTYHNSFISNRKCRLVHVFFSPEAGIGLREFHNFINGLGDDVIFGYSYSDTDSKVKLIMICN